MKEHVKLFMSVHEGFWKSYRPTRQVSGPCTPPRGSAADRSWRPTGGGLDVGVLHAFWLADESLWAVPAHCDRAGLR